MLKVNKNYERIWWCGMMGICIVKVYKNKGE